MLHVLYITINIFCSGRESKIGECHATSYGPLRLNGVNRRSEKFLLLSDLLFAREGCTRSRYKRVEIRVVLGCVLGPPGVLGIWGECLFIFR